MNAALLDMAVRANSVAEQEIGAVLAEIDCPSDLLTRLQNARIAAKNAAQNISEFIAQIDR